MNSETGSYVNLEIIPGPNGIFLIGPLLNAATMESMGWLNASRIWTPPGTEEWSRTVELRPLARPDLPGFLCARVGGLLFEFRIQERWDAGINRPAVLIHSFSAGNSYIHTSAQGVNDMGEGDSWQIGTPGAFLEPWSRVLVSSIDPSAMTATLQIDVHPDRRPSVGPGTTFGGVDVGAGGFVIVNGKVRRIPPNSPLLTLLQQIDQVQAAEEIADGINRASIQNRALGDIASHASLQALRLTGFRQPLMAVPGPVNSPASGTAIKD